MKKKTISIKELVDRANRVFKYSADEYKQGREALYLFINSILMDTGNYRGFAYIEKEDMQKVAEELKSCNFIKIPSSYGIDSSKENRFENADDSRIRIVI